MRTDMLGSFPVQSSKSSIDLAAAETKKNQVADDKGSGLAMNGIDRAEKVRFQRMFERVAQGNKAAERVTRENTVGKPVAKKLDTKDTARATAETMVTVYDTNESIAGQEVFWASNDEARLPDLFAQNGAGDTASEQATEIMVDAIRTISDVLGFPLLTDSDHFSLDTISSDTMEQISEIVFILKKMMQSLEAYNPNNLPIDTGNLQIDAGNIDTLTRILQANTFKIEVACNSLGIGAEIQDAVTEKMKGTDTGGIVPGGIPLASDPSLLSQHNQKFFNGIYDTANNNESDTLILIQTIKKLLSENDGGRIEFSTEKISGTNTSSDRGQFESPVYRALLKIDTMVQVHLENKTAVDKAEKGDLSAGGNETILIAKNFSDAVSSEDATEVLLPEIKPGLQNISPGTTRQTVPDALLKITEESVTSQITEKVHSVIRSGFSEVRIQLRPESLGEVRMRIRMEGDLVTAKIEVQNQQVKEIVERNFGVLKEALAQHNISTGSLSVEINDGSGKHSNEAFNNQWMEQETAQKRDSDDHENDRDIFQNRDEESNVTKETGRRYGSNSIEYFA